MLLHLQNSTSLTDMEKNFWCATKKKIAGSEWIHTSPTTVLVPLIRSTMQPLRQGCPASRWLGTTGHVPLPLPVGSLGPPKFISHKFSQPHKLYYSILPPGSGSWSREEDSKDPHSSRRVLGEVVPGTKARGPQINPSGALCGPEAVSWTAMLWDIFQGDHPKLNTCGRPHKFGIVYLTAF